MDGENIEDIYKLSPTQHGYLFNVLYAAESSIFFEQVLWMVQELDVPNYVQAWQKVVERHPILRTAFFWEGLDEPLQVVKRRVELPVEQLDWCELDQDARRERREAFLKADRRRGFDLSEAPLMRLALMRLDEMTYNVVWTYHHILLDGWSVILLFEEVNAWYDAFKKGRNLSLPQPRPFRDYITWLRQKDWQATRTFWCEKLAGLEAAASLSIDHAPGSLPSPQATFSEQKICLSAEMTSTMQTSTRRHRITANALIRAAWALLLHRYGGGDDIVFGVIVHGRPTNLRGFESMVGLFINAIPVRVCIPAGGSVLDWLRALQAEFAELLRYGYTSLVQIQSWNDISRNKPMFDYVLVDQSDPGQTSNDRNGLGYQLLEVTGYSLTVYLNADSGLTLQVVYERGRFDDQAITRLLGHLQVMLTALVTDPEQPLSQVPILTGAEQQRLLVEWNDTHRAYDWNTCLPELFEAQVARAPDAVAVTFQDEQITCQELNRRANQLAHYLQALGVGPEVLTGVCMERSLELVVGLLAILKAGGVYLPLDPTYPQERLVAILQDTQVPVVLTQSRWAAQLSSHSCRTVCLDTAWSEIAREGENNPVCVATVANLAYQIYTSGSTGKPKGVGVEQRQLLNRFAWMWEEYAFAQHEVGCQKTTINFVDSLWELLGPLLQGIRIVIIPDQVLKDPRQLIPVLAAHHVSRIWLVPSLLRAILETWPDLQKHLPHLRFWVTSGEPLSGQLLRRFRAAMPGSLLINLYGTSEVFDATLYEAGLDTQGLASVPIGHPIANVQVYVLDSNLRPVPVGVPGELYVGGVGLARGYLNQPALTAVRFVPDPFGDRPGARLYRTGDGVQYLPDGEIEFLGRLDYQVKIRGYRIEPGDVEAALVQHPAVRQTVVVAALTVQDAEGESDGKRLVAYVVPEQEATPEAGELRRFLQQKLPDYMVPAVFVTLEALPLTPNGKVDRLALPAPDRARPDLEEKFVAPRTRVEESLARVWSQLLGVEQVGVYDDFFELGGHSLLTTRLISHVRQLFEVEIPLRTVLENPTIAELAEQIAAKQLEPAENGMTCADSGTDLIPLTSGQYFFFEQNPINPHHYNLDGFIQAPFAINTALLEKVLRYLEQYHDALRLRFFRDESSWRQHIVPAGEQIPLYVLDLSEYPVAEQERVLASEIKKPQASLNITHGPTWTVVLFDLGPERPARILFIIHHLIADGWSIPILFQDMQAAYLQLLQGQEIRLAREKTSFTAWARRLYEFAQSPQLRQEVTYWLADGRKHTPEFPRDYHRGPNNMASSDIVTGVLDRDDTQSLIEWVRREPGVQIGDVLLGALVYTLVEWVGGRTLLIDVVKHGREEIFPDVNLTRTVGWLAVGFPMFFDLTGAADLSAAWLSIRQQLASVPNAGLGFSLLTHSCEDKTIGDKLKAMPKSKVLFNFIGELGQARSEAPADSKAPDDDSQADDQELLDHRDAHNLEQMRPFLFHVETYLPANGTLCIEWGYSTNLYRRSTIQTLAQNTFNTVRALLNLSGCSAGGAHIASQLRS